MWTLLDEKEGADKEKNRAELTSALLSLKDSIREIRAIDVKNNLKEKAGTNYDICLICDFDSYADLQRYQEHVEHQRVVSFVKKVRHSRACIDFEI
jgi:hypothetical protein